MKKVVGFLLVLCCLFSFGQEPGQFVDARDGYTYKTVTVNIVLEGDVTIQRTWMAENLRYEVPESFCYKNEPA
ncbi:MAG: FISUMP domain-containing protein, partial [Bacteroidota bacterium]